MLMTSMDSLLELRGVRKFFGPVAAVDGLSLHVGKCEVVGLLGPNGAGKSTTVSMCVGLLAPDSGSVEVAGLGPPTTSAARMRLGVAPQSLALYEDLSAQENLMFFGALVGLDGAQARDAASRMLDRVGLTDRRRDRVKVYSGGMKRRLNLAAAILHDPPLVLLDEPTAGVDPQSRSAILDLVRDLRARGHGVVYTTHYMEEAQRLCDRIAIMDHGRLLALDTLEGLVGAHGGVSVVTADLVKPPDDPAVLPAALDGLHLRFESKQPLHEVSRLASSGVAFASLNVSRPDLETVFLSLTGRSLRD